MKKSSCVQAWEEQISFPTYPLFPPNKNPMFFEKRVYQGSSGKVYPHAVTDRVSNQKIDQTYKGLFLENEYLKILILPELSGRVHMAIDKTNGYHFVYYNRVIKPALVGLTGPWISGGIEFNWPQHHRPSTMDPIDYLIEENKDGSKTIWVNEIERMFRTKGMAGFTLYPGKAYLELKGRLYNQTELPQTFLWWANPAVHVNEHYHSVFPPDVTTVFDHGRRDVSSFPIANGVYYKVDYSPGTDISKYDNIPVPTSYMAVESEFDFLGGYDPENETGILVVADHHVSPGKKQWTWGNGEFGKMWERQLTDEDGPYIELMAGVFTDNQPDFSFIMPGEKRQFEQYFMPYKKIGKVKNASIDAAVNLELIGDSQVKILVYATSVFPEAEITLFSQETEIFKTIVEISPLNPFTKTLDLPPCQSSALTITIKSSSNRLLTSYSTSPLPPKPTPSPAKPIPTPSSIPSNDTLYLSGLHLEQYRHATFNPEDYYKEALKRDPADYRCNNAMGVLLYRKGRFSDAEGFFRKAVETLTQYNPNPLEGETFYNLGLCLRMMGREKEAFKEFYKACWNAAWQDGGFFQMALVKAGEKKFEEAYGFCEKAMGRNLGNVKNGHLKAILLRKIGMVEKTMKSVKKNLKRDVFDFGSRYEQFLLLKMLERQNEAEECLEKFRSLMRGNENNYLEISLQYAKGGFYHEAISLLEIIQETSKYPLIDYYLCFYHYKNGDQQIALKYAQYGYQKCPDRVFPNKLEDIEVLNTVISMNPHDFKALYYLGNLFYDKKEYDFAIEAWENSLKIETNFPTTHRNLGIAYFNQRNDAKIALEHFEKAFNIDTKDGRVLYELDQLYKKIGRDPFERLKLLNEHNELVEERDDLLIEKITLLNLTSSPEKAFQILLSHEFHPWEGGEGKVSSQYVQACLELAKENLLSNDFLKSLEFLQKSLKYPLNLGEGKLYKTRENDVNFLLGAVYEKMGKSDFSRKSFFLASEGDDEPKEAIFYNDQPPEQILYKGLALRKLGEGGKSREIFEKMVDFGIKHFDDKVKIDYFAVSLPDLQVFNDDLCQKNKNHCNFVIGLGYLGLGEENLAKEKFLSVLEKDKSHQGAKIHLKLLENAKKIIF